MRFGTRAWLAKDKNFVSSPKPVLRFDSCHINAGGQLRTVVVIISRPAMLLNGRATGSTSDTTRIYVGNRKAKDAQFEP